MKKILIKTIVILGGLYIIFIGILYFFQEKFLFAPDKLPKDFKFDFPQDFKEFHILTEDSIMLNGLLFKADTSKGLVFFLHGNAGSLNSVGKISKIFTDLNYDLFILDYRGFGKSEGKIKNQNQFFHDNQIVYDILKQKYDENKTIIYGYSLGSGLATKLASSNSSRLLILQAPYYSYIDLIQHKIPFVPGFLLKYKIRLNKYIKDCKMPIVIFHGDNDEVISHSSSIKLMKLTKPDDQLITIYGQGHNHMTDNKDYLKELNRILSN